MSLVANIVEGAIALVAGALLACLFLWWKRRQFEKAQSASAQSLLEKARADAEAITREARLTANEEALKVREEAEKASAVRRAERADLERRLSEREGLINSQLARVLEAEKSLKAETESLGRKTEALESQRSDLQRQAHNYLAQ